MATLALGPVITAIRDVLEDAAGSHRTITASTYGGGAYAGLSNARLSTLALVRPRFDIRILKQAQHRLSPPRNNSLGIWEVSIEISAYRHIDASEKLIDADRDTAVALAANDADVFAQALEWPGNLTVDSAAHATNIIGAALIHDESQLGQFNLSDTGPGLIQTVHRYHCFIKVARTV